MRNKNILLKLQRPTGSSGRPRTEGALSGLRENWKNGPGMLRWIADAETFGFVSTRSGRRSERRNAALSGGLSDPKGVVSHDFAAIVTNWIRGGRLWF